ncbi:MAG: hypothetical protein WC378_08110 [Opitutaceae bacterium]|jgi:hypothetical protein
MKKIFVIEYLGTPAFEKRIDQTIFPYAGNPTPAVDLIRRLANPPLSCVTAVFEFSYVDKDYQDEFAAYYAKAFKGYPARCVRIHFFATHVPPHTRFKLHKYAAAYRGYLIIRPTDLQRLGRTLLPPTITDADRQFVHCVAPFKAHILGQIFHIEGMPFMQQDTQVGACAQASLWMIARYFSARFGLREYLPSQINNLAKAGLAMGRPLPADRGLTAWQMLDALQGMGIEATGYNIDQNDNVSTHIDTAFPVEPLQPDNANLADYRRQFERRRSAKLADIAYRYIESGLPVIFQTHNHAFVGIGHTYDPEINAIVAIQRIPAFIVHNDAEGPYLELPLFGSSSSALSFPEVIGLIAVLPREVTLRGEEAETRARTVIGELVKPKREDGSVNPFYSAIEASRPDLVPLLGKLEFRTYLVASAHFQASITQDIVNKRFGPALGYRLLVLDYPRYVWITEVSSSDLLNKPNRSDRRCIGRVIVDSTAPAHTRGEMVVHFCDLALFIGRNDGAQKISHFPNSSPFTHRS